jgi:hypothetical protein
VQGASYTAHGEIPKVVMFPNQAIRKPGTGFCFADATMLCPLLLRNFYYDTFAARKGLSLQVETI